MQSTARLGRDTTTLDAIAGNPSLVRQLAAEEIPRLIGLAAQVQATLLGHLLRETIRTPATPAAGAGSRWLNAAEVAQITGLTKAHVYELCRRGLIPSSKQGKYRRIPEDRLVAWQAAQVKGGLDATGSVTLPSPRDSGGGSPRQDGPRAVTVEVRRTGRRPLGNRQEMGVGGAEDARHHGAADHDAGCAKQR